MYILSEGISWYNKFGYISKKFEEEKVYNQKIMNIELLEYMNLILQSKLLKLNINIDSLYKSVKDKINKKKFNTTIIKSIMEIIGQNKLINDEIILEAVKKHRDYYIKINNINSEHDKFIKYINISSSKLINYIENTTKISDIIKIFRKRIKEKILDDCELEFIKYILDSSRNILKYDSDLIKIIYLKHNKKSICNLLKLI